MSTEERPLVVDADVRTQVALCRAYNDWLADYCTVAKDRLVGAAGRPIHHPSYARFWECAAEFDVAITVHEGCPTICRR